MSLLDVRNFRVCISSGRVQLAVPTCPSLFPDGETRDEQLDDRPPVRVETRSPAARIAEAPKTGSGEGMVG